jgi:hypothetical protein
MLQIEDKTENRTVSTPSHWGLESDFTLRPQAQDRGVGTVSAIRDGMGDIEPALKFSFPGLDMYERGSRLGESGRDVSDDPETSVIERRCKKPSRYIMVFCKADRL